MGIETISRSLKERFKAPLGDYYKRRIIFWQDPEGEFAEEFDALELEDVKVLKLTGTNNFYAKKLLLEDDTKSDYLVYNPIAYEHVSDNWLCDIELYSEEFRADMVSMRMSDIGVEDNQGLRKTMRTYSKFFDNKERVEKLKRLGTEYNRPSDLMVDIMAVLAGTSDNTPSGVIKALLMSGMNKDDNFALQNICKFGNEADLKNMITSYTGYEEDEFDLKNLSAHILLTAFAATATDELLKGIEQYISDSHRNMCYHIIDDWLHSDDDDALYYIARDVEERCNLDAKFDKIGVSELLNVECFPCINEAILRKFMTEISHNVIKVDDIMMAAEKRRTMKWYKRVSYYYEGLLQVAKMQKFKHDNAMGIHAGTYQELWNKYIEDYYLMDSYYRHFHTAFGKSMKNTATVLADMFKNVADYVEKLYKNWYLTELSSNWTSLITEALESKAELAVDRQRDFYSNYVKKSMENGRTYVIVSDALRYEVGMQLKEELLATTRGKAEITAMQSILPSVTKLGMAALLPHEELSLESDMNPRCDGLICNDTAKREKILKAHNEGNVAITYKNFIALKKDEKRNLVGGAKVAYIYHNTIDAMGDKLETEDQVFEACEDAINEIKNLVRVITNELSGANILITADHGFLYNNKPLEEFDKADSGLLDGELCEVGRRYVIAEPSATAQHVMRIPLANVMNTDKVMFAFKDNIRLKKQGGGVNYVHGGVSLQEMVVPVITFKNLRESSKQFVETSKAGIKLISQTRKISNTLFNLDFYQDEAVGGKVVSATYDVFVTDEVGNIISNNQPVIADKTEPNKEDRVMRLKFNLKNMDYDKTKTYYLTISERESGVVEKIEFEINIAFTDDFGF